MWKQVKRHPMHLTLGLGMMTIGLWLMSNDRFFLWPPEMIEFVNDDVWGFTFILTGIALLIWVGHGGKSIKWNSVFLIIASVLLMFLTFYQFIIWTQTGAYMSWISNAIITAFVVILARGSDTRDD